MQIAQQSPKHSAQLAVMQAAYCADMTDASPRHARRRAKLREIVDAYDGRATGLALATGTPKSHISAILAGRRGIGDVLAAKFERASKKPQGWLDEMTLTAKELTVIHALRAPDATPPAPRAAGDAHQTPTISRGKPAAIEDTLVAHVNGIFSRPPDADLDDARRVRVKAIG